MIQSLPQSAANVIDAYWKLKAAENTYVRCPYFRNPRSGRERWGLAAYSGKGSPEEIEVELKIIEKLERKDFSKMRDTEIRDIMKKRKLGIECSGFIARVLDGWTRDFYKKPVYRLLKFERSGLGFIFCKLRPYTHLDVPTLVHAKNAKEIFNFRDIMPGDILRFNSIVDHAILVTCTERDAANNLQKICYAQSVLEETREGVKYGIIDIIHTNSNRLADQRWREEPETGHTIQEKGEPKIFRLFIIEQAHLW
ncbi:MAG: hypothetical protein HYS15_02825 [Candidatus Spechtbacteria bacterium]|nr:hypothetical protein [Candidatus Spechtbacteria bacterium]